MCRETKCPDCRATGLHGCTGKKYPGSDDNVGINNFTTYPYQDEMIDKLNIGDDLILRKDKRINSFYGASLVDEIFIMQNDLVALERLKGVKAKPFLEIFTKDAIRRDLILNGYEPNDYL